MRIAVLIVIALIGLTDASTAQSKEAIDCLRETPKKRYSDQSLAERRTRAEQAKIEMRRLGFHDDPDQMTSTHVKPKLSKSISIAYPRCASVFALSGDCTVYFDVTAAGHTKDVFAYCSDILFQDSAEKLVSELVFEPATIDGVPIDYLGAVTTIPFEFSIKSNPPAD